MREELVVESLEDVISMIGDDKLHQIYQECLPSGGKFPTDLCGSDISEGATFRDCIASFDDPTGKALYDTLGVLDSVVRERVFDEIAKSTGQPYGSVYDAWIDGEPGHVYGFKSNGKMLR